MAFNLLCICWQCIGYNHIEEIEGIVGLSVVSFFHCARLLTNILEAIQI